MNFFSAWKNKKKDIESEMTFFGHLGELRKHLVRICVCLVVLIILSFSLFDYIFHHIILGPKQETFLTYRLLCFISQAMPALIKDLCDVAIPINIINIQLAGQFMTQINSSFMFALILTIPYAIWELWKFIKPGLNKKEKQSVTGFAFWAILLFILGVCFGYFVASPLSIHFLANYSISSEVQNQITISSYVSTLSILTLSTGIIFELPMLVLILSKLGLLTSSFMAKYRKYSIVVILLIAAVITPTPDVITMLAVGTPIYFLYEISILVAARKKKEE